MLWRALVIVLGLWLTASPAVFGYTDHPTAKLDWIMGPIIVAFAAVAIAEATRAVRWANVPAGATVFIGGLFGATDAAIINHAVVGVAVVAMALVRGKTKHRFGGGWRALVASEG